MADAVTDPGRTARVGPAPGGLGAAPPEGGRRPPRHAAGARRPLGPTRSERSFAPALAVIAGAALLGRVLYVLRYTEHVNTKVYDATWYEFQALSLATGHFFPVFFGSRPDAAHPPLTAMSISPVTYVFGLHPGAVPQRLTMAVLGTVVVVLAGILGRRLAGAAVGLVAAGIAAVYPNLWIPSGIVMSETLTMLIVALILLATYRVLRAPSALNAGLLGLACGAGMLARAELVLLLAVLVVPAALTRRVTWRRRLAMATVALVVAALTVGPWVGRNLASFHDATFLSSGEGPVLSGANCPQTYSGPYLGSWSLSCSLGVAPATDQSVESARQAATGVRYSAAHLGQLPLVILARVGRVWDFYEPLQMIDNDVNEGRPVPPSLAGLAMYYLLLPAAAVGAVALRRRGVRVWPLVVVAAVVTVVAAAGYGLVRFRAEFEVPLVVLAAAGAEAAWRRLTGTRPGPGTGGVPGGTGPAPEGDGH